jgi:hypothetical protein
VTPRRIALAAGFEPSESIPLAAMGDVVRRLAGVPNHGPTLEALAFGGDELRSQAALPIFEAAHRAASSFGHPRSAPGIGPSSRQVQQQAQHTAVPE